MNIEIHGIERNCYDVIDAEFIAFLSCRYSAMKKHSIFVCKDVVLAQDILQEALCRAWKYRFKLQRIDAIESWLKVIIKREFIRYVSTTQYQKTEVMDDELQDTENMDVSKNGEFMQVVDFVSSLPEMYRTPFELSINGMCNKEIASKLKMNKNTVVTQIFRARKIVKKQFYEKAENINDK